MTHSVRLLVNVSFGRQVTGGKLHAAPYMYSPVVPESLVVFDDVDSSKRVEIITAIK